MVLGFVFGLLVEHLVVDTHAREGFADRTVHAALGQSLGALRKGLDARLDRLDVIGDDERGEAFDKRVAPAVAKAVMDCAKASGISKLGK